MTISSFSSPPMDRVMLPESKEEPWDMIPHPDVRVQTSDGRKIAVHAKFLISESDVLRFMIFDRPMKKDGDIPIVSLGGVPYDAVVTFIRCLYSSSSSGPAVKKEEIEKYGVHLLALSHVLCVPWLKHAVTNDLVLTMDNVVDMLKLSQLCDAPALTLRSLTVIRRHFPVVVLTDGWNFIRENDPKLELQVLRFNEEYDKRDKRTKKMKKNLVVYIALSEAIECLHHICIEGCTVYRQPNGENMNIEPKNGKKPCIWGNTCRNLQRKLRHFEDCDAIKNKTSVMAIIDEDCSYCRKMWHLFYLHSALCDGEGICNVPLCSLFKISSADLNHNSKEWKLLIKKVGSIAVFTRMSIKRRFGIC